MRTSGSKFSVGNIFLWLKDFFTLSRSKTGVSGYQKYAPTIKFQRLWNVEFFSHTLFV